MYTFQNIAHLLGLRDLATLEVCNLHIVKQDRTGIAQYIKSSARILWMKFRHEEMWLTLYAKPVLVLHWRFGLQFGASVWSFSLVLQWSFGLQFGFSVKFWGFSLVLHWSFSVSVFHLLQWRQISYFTRNVQISPYYPSKLITPFQQKIIWKGYTLLSLLNFFGKVSKRTRI